MLFISAEKNSPAAQKIRGAQPLRFMRESFSAACQEIRHK
jgi:hypothetical protein